MPIYKGNTKIVKLYKSSTQIVKRYKGTDIIYSASRLPSAFQEVEYIESSGTQYIDTWYQPNQDTKVDTNVLITQFPSSENAGNILGSRTAYGNSQYQLISWKIQNHVLEFRYGSRDYTASATISLTENTKYNIVCSKLGLYVNNVLSHAVNTSTFQTSYNLYIFGYNNAGVFSSPSFIKLYSCQIYDNNTLVRDFVPCYRKSDNEIGLYDLVNGVFYTNAGTGTFIVGGNV